MKSTLFAYFLISSFFTLAWGEEFQVNTRTSLDQADPAISMNPAGNFVVVWSSRFSTPGRSNDILGQRFDPNCNPVGGEFQINTTISGNQTEPSVAMNALGYFVIVWHGPGLIEEDQEDIFAQRFDPNGLPVDTEFLVNTYTQGKQRYPKVAMNMDGMFVIVWESEKLEADTTVVSCQLFDANGLVVGEEFEVNLLDDCRYPDIAIDPNGNFAVVWMEDGSSNNLIIIRLFNADGTARTKPLETSTINFNTITRPAIAMDANGYFVVAWDGDPERASQDDVHAHLFDPNGIPLGEQFVVNTTLDGAQQYPQVAKNDFGEFVIVWQGESGLEDYGTEIFGRRFNSLGEPIGDEFQLNTYIEGNQKSPAVAIRENGNFVTVWQSDDQDGSGWGIFGEKRSMADSNN